MLRPVTGGLLAGAALAFALAGTAGAATVELRNLAARVTIVPEARSDIQVTVVRTNPRLPVRVREQRLGERAVVEGDVGPNWLRLWLGGRVASCPEDGERPSVKVLGAGSVAYDDLPQIVVRTPPQARIRSRGVVLGAIGRSQAVDLAVAGCDRWTIANVRDDLKVRYAGEGRVRAGSAGRLMLKIVGSGEVSANQIARGLGVEIAGSGDVTVAQASGPVKVEIAGDGSVRVGGGHAAAVVAKIAGSGDVDYGGTADSLQASIAGSGDVHAARVTGRVAKSIAGSGRVSVGP